MGRVTGGIVGLEFHPSGPWARVSLSGGETIYMHNNIHLASLAETFGTFMPPLAFEFEISLVWRQVKSFRAADGSDMGSPDLQRQTHALFGAQFDEKLKTLPAEERETAKGLNLNGLVARSRQRGVCMEPLADLYHDTKNCVLQTGHDSSHVGRCLACYRVVALEI